MGPVLLSLFSEPLFPSPGQVPRSTAGKLWMSPLTPPLPGANMTINPLSVLESPDQLSAQWITSVLQAAGELPRPSSSVSYRSNPAFNSAIVHVDLLYSESLAGPSHIILKVSRNDLGKNEVEFYDAVRNRNDLTMLVPCYYAAHRPTGLARRNLILADLSLTRRSSVRQRRVSHSGCRSKR